MYLTLLIALIVFSFGTWNAILRLSEITSERRLPRQAGRRLGLYNLAR